MNQMTTDWPFNINRPMIYKYKDWKQRNRLKKSVK